MATHEDLYPLFLAEAPGCPTPFLRTAINRAAAEFCADSLVWQETLDTFPVVNGVPTYELDLPTGSAVVVVRDVRWARGELKPIADPRQVADWDTAIGLPQRYARPSLSDLRLYPIPDGVDAGSLLTVKVALKPTLTATSLPDVLVDHYYEAIAEGAKAVLKRMPGQPWTDTNGAGAAYTLFKTKTAEARVDVEYGHVTGSLRVTPIPFGG